MSEWTLSYLQHGTSNLDWRTELDNIKTGKYGTFNVSLFENLRMIDSYHNIRDQSQFGRVILPIG